MEDKKTPKIEHKVIDGKKYLRYEGDKFWQEEK